MIGEDDQFLKQLREMEERFVSGKGGRVELADHLIWNAKALLDELERLQGENERLRWHLDDIYSRNNEA